MGHDAMLDERGASCATGAAGKFCSSLAAQAGDLGTQGEVARSEYERARVQRAVNWLCNVVCEDTIAWCGLR